MEKELFQTDLKVVAGTVPKELNGTFLRTGPNPQHQPWGGYHWYVSHRRAHEQWCPASCQCAICSIFPGCCLQCLTAMPKSRQKQHISIGCVNMCESRHYMAPCHAAEAVCRFDGDGMVHALHFQDGKAQSYSNHWIRCDRFVEEQEKGSNVYMRVRLMLFRAPEPLTRTECPMPLCTVMMQTSLPCQSPCTVANTTRTCMNSSSADTVHCATTQSRRCGP